MNWFHRLTVNIFCTFYPIKVIGKENIPEGGAILVCNHFRAIDCGFIAKIYPKDIFFLAKKEIFEHNPIAPIILSYGAIPIDRDKPEISAMMKSIRVLKQGHKLCVFPEGTRNKSGTTDLQELKGGVVLFATSAKVPIVPIMMNRRAKFLHKTHLIIGKPISFDEFYGKKLAQDELKELDDKVRNQMIEEQKKLFSLLSKKG